MIDSRPAVLGRWPLLWPAVGAVFGLLAADLFVPWLLSVAVAGSIFIGINFKRSPLVLAGVCGLAFAVVHSNRVNQRDKFAHELSRRDRVELSGTVVQSNSSGLVRRAFAVDGRGMVTLLDLPDDIQTGEKIRITGQPIGTRLSRNPSGLDMDEILRERGYAGSIKVLTSDRLGRSWGFSRLRGWAEQLRTWLGQAVTRGIQNRDSADVVRAVVLGEKAGGSEAFEDFRRTGTMHIFAVSGLHVGLVAFLVMGFAKLVRLPPRPMILLILVSMIAYVMVTGLKPPAARAALMGGFILARYFLKRRSAVLNNLFAALLVVLAVDSFQLWQAGFQLSFLVVGVILAFEPIFWRGLEPLLREDSYLPKQLWTRFQNLAWMAKEKVGRAFTVSCAAWLGSSPLNLAYFGWFTPVTALASVLMVGVAFVLLLFALISAGLGLFWIDGSRLLNGGNGAIAGWSRQVASEMGSWPGASQRLKPEAPWSGGLVVFDLPYGGASAHLDAGGGVLIDGGSRVDFERIILPPLEKYGLSVDSVIATHADSSHVSGLEIALSRQPVKQVLLPRNDREGSLELLRVEAERCGVEIVESTDGLRLPIEPDVECLIYKGSEGIADDRCLVVKINWSGWKLLFTGDIGLKTERSLLARGVDLESDVWICGRHERDLQGSREFLQSIQPSVVIANDLNYPSGERLQEGWQDWLEDQGIAFFNQSYFGAVYIHPQESRLTVSGYLDKKRITLLRPSSDNK